MFRSVLLAGLAAAAFVPAAIIPVLAHAQDERGNCLEQKHDNRVVGTVLGGIGGALLGNAIGEHGGREGGTILGGVGGAVAGNAIGAGTVHCGSNRYGYYDQRGRWIPSTSTAYGFYDADGRWVDTTGRGAGDRGYAGQGYGNQAYGNQGYAPPPARSYAPPPPSYGDQYATNGGAQWRGAPMGTRQREQWLRERIQQRVSEGAIDDRRGRHALRELSDIERMDADYRGGDGHLNDDQRRDIMARLDAVRADASID
jgi:hypothetical protein